MIVQITMARNELALIKELLPIWSQHTDGFVFMLDRCNDGSFEYLNEVKETYNILEIITNTGEDGSLIIETNIRQRLFDTAYKYSNKIICLDSDEYLDGQMSKQQLEQFLDDNPDTVFHLQWKQYTSCNTLRVDGPWKNNFKDRIGCYSEACKFEEKQNHSTHLPMPKNQKALDPESLFIAHLQWLDKTHVAIKQYYWKVYDYVNNLVHNVQIVGNKAYDESVNDFKWEEEYTFIPLKISPYTISKTAQLNNYKLDYIKSKTEKHNIPNLGNWGYDFMSMNNEATVNLNPYKLSVITAIGPLNRYSDYILRYFNNAIEQHFFLETEHIIVYSEWSDQFDVFKKYPNFKLIQEDKKAGMYHAWNLGVKAATTKYLTNWNVDDLRHPINTKIKYDLLENNDFDVAYNYYAATIDPNENFNNLDLSKKNILQFPDNYENHYKVACLIGPDPVWKKELHDKAGYFNQEEYSIIGDWEMWARFAKAGAKFKLIPEVLAIYLDHPNTVSKESEDKLEQQKVKLYKAFESEY
jgi:hypothetical protein